MLRRVALYPQVGPEVALADLSQVFAGKRLEDLQDIQSVVPHVSTSTVFWCDGPPR